MLHVDCYCPANSIFYVSLIMQVKLVNESHFQRIIAFQFCHYCINQISLNNMRKEAWLPYLLLQNLYAPHAIAPFITVESRANHQEVISK